ncbi:hypothetical protein [Adhaeribacter aquaticus]|uniref:hypothetical protein n=1 Tax=Adhaeribacter aquaticus TaxID=299567 RepID=UPI00047E3244|nr:hypothetical protein [Adhaeribacter aquaticus]
MVKIGSAIMVISGLLAIAMLIDFIIKGEISVEKIQTINQRKESYHNPAGYYHISWNIQTENHDFNISESFGLQAKQGQEIQVKISPIFKEINSVKNLETGKEEVYSLRIFSGLLLPVVVLITLAIGFKLKEKASTIVFVIEVIIFANLIYLLN